MVLRGEGETKRKKGGRSVKPKAGIGSRRITPFGVGGRSSTEKVEAPEGMSETGEGGSRGKEGRVGGGRQKDKHVVKQGEGGG